MDDNISKDEQSTSKAGIGIENSVTSKESVWSLMLKLRAASSTLSTAESIVKAINNIFNTVSISNEALASQFWNIINGINKVFNLSIAPLNTNDTIQTGRLDLVPLVCGDTIIFISKDFFGPDHEIITSPTDSIKGFESESFMSQEIGINSIRGTAGVNVEDFTKFMTYLQTRQNSEYKYIDTVSRISKLMKNLATHNNFKHKHLCGYQGYPLLNLDYYIIYVEYPLGGKVELLKVAKNNHSDKTGFDITIFMKRYDTIEISNMKKYDHTEFYKMLCSSVKNYKRMIELNMDNMPVHKIGVLKDFLEQDLKE
jgi:hypothetical protein